jgi:hypothetical protein
MREYHVRICENFRLKYLDLLVECHEFCKGSQNLYKRVVQKMRDGPSESACRSGFQTTAKLL